MRGGLIAGLMGTMLISPVAAAESTPAGAARAFYDVYIEARARGIPDAETRARFAPVITSALEEELTEARAAEDRHAAATGNREPPLVGGDLFSSLFEGAKAAEIGACVTERARAYCEAKLTYAEADAKPVVWTDRVALVESARGWLVDDIAYGGDWDFGPKGHLRETLRAAIRDMERDAER